MRPQVTIPTQVFLFLENPCISSLLNYGKIYVKLWKEQKDRNACWNVVICNSSDRSAHLLRRPYENMEAAGIQLFAAGEFLWAGCVTGQASPTCYSDLQREGELQMIRIAVVEDDEDYITIIKNYIVRYMKEKGDSISVDVFRDGNQIVFDYQPVYDILLMDIEMPKLDGISAAEKIREYDKDVIIIFITNMAQYALKGYQVRARSYILKPVNYYSLALELQEAIGTISRKVEDALLLKDDDILRKVNVNDIYYLESQQHYMIVHTRTGNIRIRESMKNMENRLDAAYFRRCNVSYLVNLAHVSSIDKDTVVVAEERVPMSRQKSKSFVLALTDYVGGNTNA